MIDPDEIKRAILPTYLRHLASMAEAATPAFAGAGPLDEPAAGECATVSVPVDVAALREAADELERLQAALVSIGIVNASASHPDSEIDRVIREFGRGG